MPTPKRRSEATFKGGLMRRPIRGSRFPLATLTALACLTWPAPAVPATPVDLKLVREIAKPRPGANPDRQLAVTGP
jgi:hypothetical protein